MEGADFHLVHILALVYCSSVRFLSCFEGQKKVLPPEKNILAGALGLNPLMESHSKPYHMTFLNRNFTRDVVNKSL